MSFSLINFSESTNGKPVQVAGATSGTETTIHTSDATKMDEITIYATNTDATAVALTLALGSTVNEAELILDAVDIEPNNSPTPILIKQPLTGSVTVKAFAGTVNKINLFGTITRIG